MSHTRMASILACLVIAGATTAGLTSTSAVATTLATADDGAAVVSQTTVDAHMIDLQINSPALGSTAGVRIILPADYAAEPTATWPVLYLLDGCCDVADYKAWTTYTSVEQYMETKDVMVVMPSDGSAGMYSNWWNFGLSSQPGWQTFHVTELQQILARDYRANTADQAIGGISIGGFGAMSYAAQNPGMFKAVASYSGLLDTVLPVLSQVVYGILIRESLDPLALWGDVGANSTIWLAHDPTALAANLRGLSLFVSNGDGIPGPLDASGASYDPLEAGTLVASQAFTTTLATLGIPVTTDYYGSGTHSWPYWQREFEDSWPQLAAALGVSA